MAPSDGRLIGTNVSRRLNLSNLCRQFHKMVIISTRGVLLEPNDKCGNSVRFFSIGIL